MNNELSSLLEEVLSRYEKGESAESLAAEFGSKLAGVDEETFVAAENQLLQSGRSVDSLRQLCDIHGAIYLSGKKKKEDAEATSATLQTPSQVTLEENQAIQAAVSALREAANKKQTTGVLRSFQTLKAVLRHYEEKEILYFPYVIRHGFRAVSQVMWAKDDEIRSLFRTVTSELNGEQISLPSRSLKELLAQVEAMGLKENGMLLPLLDKNLTAEEWKVIAEEMVESPHPLLTTPLSRASLGLGEKANRYGYENGRVMLPSGSFTIEELSQILNRLDVELTFIDKEGKFRYFNRPQTVGFLRSVPELDEAVEDCHPLKALPAVKGVLSQLASGGKAEVDFSLVKAGKRIENRYLALRDETGNYLGCLEITKVL